jgi:hypothetical protein
MPITVRAPDGTLVNFPDGMSDSDITRVMRQNYPPSSAAKPKKKKKEEESFLSGVIPTFTGAIGDLASTLGLGLQQAAPYLGTTAGIASPLLSLAGALQKDVGKKIKTESDLYLPEASKQERIAQQKYIKEAKPGLGSQALSVFSRAAAANPTVGPLARQFLPQTPVEAARSIATVQAPFQTARGASEFVASQLPATLLPMGGGKAVQLVGKRFLPVAGREAAEAALARQVGIGVTTAGGTINAVDAGSQAYADVLAKGGTQEEADRAFKIAAAGAGIVSAAATKIPGLEQLAFAEKPAKGGILRSAGRAVIGEAPQEFAEEAGSKLATNVAKLGTAAEVPIGEDVLSSGVLGAIGGGIMAAPLGGLQGAFNRGATDDGTPPPPSSSRASRPPPPPPPPPADMGTLSKALGPVGGKVTLNEPSGPRDYTYQGIDEDGSVVLADEDGVIYSEDPAQVQAAIKAGVAAPESGLGGMAFGMDITEDLPDVVAPPPPPPPPPPRAADYVPSPPKPKLIIEPDAPVVAAAPTTVLPIDEDVDSYMQEYAKTRTPSQMRQVEDDARKIATERGAESVSTQDMLQAGMAFDNALFKTVPDEAPEKVAIAPYRPDKREPAVVWDKFSKSFEGQDFPNLSWALGSDWTMGSGVPNKASYRRNAEALMTRLYGPRPEAVQEPVQEPEIPAPVVEAPSPKNTQKQSKVGNVIFDQVNGVGQVPLNQNVKYRGFTAMMRPSKFLELAADIDKPKQSSLNFIRDSIDEGRGVGSPFLSLDFKTGKIKGHDGRHRMMVIQEKNGDEPVPVHIFGEGEGRAKSLNQKKISAFGSSLTSEGGNQSTDNFSEAFLEDAVVPVTAPIAEEPELPPPPPERVRTVTTPGGSKVNTAFEVVDAADLIAATGDLQNRQRDRDSTALQVQDIFSKFDPERLGESLESDRGSPIIGFDNVIESGNGRVMVINKVYDESPEKAAAYRKFIEDQGFDISGIDRPVLVRRRTDRMSPEERSKFVRESNMDTKLQLSTSEKAQTDAASLTPDVMGLMASPDVNASVNQGFVRAFLSKLPTQEQAAFLDKDGRLSAEGSRRLRTAVKSSAYGDADLINTLDESQDNNIKSIGGALEDVAPAWRRMLDAIKEGDVEPEMDTTKQLVEAAKIVRDVRNKGTKIADFLAQNDAFNPLDPVTERFIRSFYNETLGRAAGREAIADVLDKYVRRASEQTTGDGLFERESMSPSEILDGILEERGSGAPQSDMFGGVEKPSQTKSRKLRSGLLSGVSTAITNPAEAIQYMIYRMQDAWSALTGKTLQTDAKLTDLLRDPDILNKMSPAQRELAAALAGVIDDDVNVKIGNKNFSLQRAFTLGLASFNIGETPEVRLRGVSTAANIVTLLHEAVHVALVAKYGAGFMRLKNMAASTDPEIVALRNEASKLVDAYRDMLTDVKYSAIDAPPYGMTDLDEFIAEGLTQPSFQKFLDKGNLWTRFVEFVRKLLGFEPKFQSQLNTVLETGAKLIAGSKNFSRMNDVEGEAASAKASKSLKTAIAAVTVLTTSPVNANINDTPIAPSSVLYKTLESGDTKKAIEIIQRSSKNPAARRIATILAANGVGDQKMVILDPVNNLDKTVDVLSKNGADQESIDLISMGDVRGMVLSTAKDKNIYLIKNPDQASNGVNEQTFLHEAIHAYVKARWSSVAAYTESNREVLDNRGLYNEEVAAEVKKFNNMWRKFTNVIKKEYEGGTEITTTVISAAESPNEALSYLLTNKGVQEYAKRIVADGNGYRLMSEKEAGKRSWWDDFVDMLRKIFGMAPARDQFFNDFLDAGNSVLAAGKKTKADFRVAAINDEAVSPKNVTNNRQAIQALINGTPKQMRNAVAKAQEPNDKIIEEGADLQKDNRGCD